jgi:hypothetical protein
MDAFVGMPVSGLPRVGDCFGLCLFEERGELILSWRRKGRKTEEAVLCVKCDTPCPVPRSTRRTGVFYRILSRQRQRSFQRVAPRTGETSPLLRVECSKAMHIVVNETSRFGIRVSQQYAERVRNDNDLRQGSQASLLYTVSITHRIIRQQCLTTRLPGSQDAVSRHIIYYQQDTTEIM